MPFLLGIFSSIGVIIKFIKDFIIKNLAFGVVITFQFTVAISTIAFIVLVYFFSVSTLLYIYNYAISILDYMTHPSGGGAVDCFLGVLTLIGFTNALNFGFSLFFASLGTIAMIKLYYLTLKAIKAIVEQITKLSTVITTALS